MLPFAGKGVLDFAGEGVLHFSGNWVLHFADRCVQGCVTFCRTISHMPAYCSPAGLLPVCFLLTGMHQTCLSGDVTFLPAGCVTFCRSASYLPTSCSPAGLLPAGFLFAGLHMTCRPGDVTFCRRVVVHFALRAPTCRLLVHRQASYLPASCSSACI